MEIDLNNLFNPKSLQEQAKDKLLENLKKEYAKLSPEDKLIVQEWLFMDMLEQIEHHVNTFIATTETAGRWLKIEDVKAMLKRIEKKVVESGERKTAWNDERNYMKAAIRNIGDLIIAHYETHLHYLKNEQWKRK